MGAAESRTELVARVGVLLRERGERMSEPRRAIVETLHGRHDHLPAEQILAEVTASYPSVHRATVYRALDALAELGIVQHVHVGHGATTYHLAGMDHHLHAQCRVCGAVLDLPRSLLDDAAAQIRERTGFRLDPDHTALSGTCAACATGVQQYRHGHA
ncbi:MAG: transcriptional repressor [Actinomycetota bacterium]|nr:transcriptional repressor [Actinomycetota bacterium]